MNELNLKVTVPADLIGKLFQNGLASVIDSCTVSVMGTESKFELKEEPKPEPKTETGVRVPRKFIKFICPECGKLNYAMVYKENNCYKMQCRGCKHDYEFFEMDLIKAEYRCSECESENYFFTPYIEDMEVKTDTCKCGHETRLKYSPDAGIFVEA